MPVKPPTPPMSPTAPTKQQKLLNELVETEKTYVSNLANLVDMYVKPLKLTASDYNLTKDHIATIFMNIEQIYSLHQLLYTELQTVPTADKPIQAVCKIIKQYSDFMKIYTGYVNGYSKCLALLSELNDNKKWCKYCADCTAKLNNLSLQSFLITPVQRIPRYEMLLKEMKNTIEKSMADLKGKPLHAADTDVQALDETLDKIQSVAKFVNERQRKFEQQAVLSNIECKLEQCDNDIKQQLFHTEDNVLLKEVELSKTAYIKKLRRVYVFTRYLLVCDKNTFKACITVKHTDITNDAENDCVFHMTHPTHKPFSFCCATTAERTMLVQLIQKQVEVCQSWVEPETELRSHTRGNTFRQSLSNLHSVSTSNTAAGTTPPTPQSRNSSGALEQTNGKPVIDTDDSGDVSVSSKPTPRKQPPPIPAHLQSPANGSTQLNGPDAAAAAAALQHSLTHKVSSPIKMKNLSIDSNHSTISVDSTKSSDLSTTQLTSTLLPESYLAQCTYEMSQLASNQLTELKQMKRPVEPVKLAIESIAILMDLPIDQQNKKSPADMYWKAVQTILVKPNFLQVLLEFNAQRKPLSARTVKMLNQYIHNPVLNTRTVSNASRPAGTVWRWIRAYYAAVTGDELPVEAAAPSDRKSLTRNNSSATTPVSTIYRAPKLSMSPSASALTKSPSTKTIGARSNTMQPKRPVTAVSRPSLSSVKPVYISHTRNPSTASLRNGTATPTSAHKPSLSTISSVNEPTSAVKPARKSVAGTANKTPAKGSDENSTPNLSRQSSTNSNASTSSVRSTASSASKPKSNKSAELRAAKTRMSLTNGVTTPAAGPKVMKASSSTKQHVLSNFTVNGTGIGKS